MRYVRIIDTPGIIKNSNQTLTDYDTFKEKILGYGEGGSLEYGLEHYLKYETETIVYSLIDKSGAYKYLFSKDYLSSFDIIFVNSINFLFENQALLHELKKKSLVIVWDGIFKDYSELKHSYHAVLTCSEDIKRKYHKLNVPSYYLPFSYDNRLDEILKVEQSKVKHERCAFIGGINLGKQSHYQRIDTIGQIQKEIDLYLKIGGKRNLKLLYLLLRKRQVALHYFNISRKNIATVHGLDYHKKILEYRGVINRHLDNILTPSNIRLFEVTGLGRVLITDRLNGLNKLFTEGEEILAYSNTNELLEKIRIVTYDKDYSKYLCRNARIRTLKDYSIQNRCLKFNDIIRLLG